MRKSKKLFAFLLASSLLLGTTLTAHAASFDFVPSDKRCLNSACGYAPLRQETLDALHYFCPGCGWDYYTYW